MSSVDEGTLAFARELEQSDARLEAALAELDELQRDVDGVRTRAAEIDAFLRALPDARAAAAARVRAAERELEERRIAAERAQQELERLERAGKDDAAAEARRAASRLRDAVSLGERKLARAVDVRAALEREAGEARAEEPQLEERARVLAERLQRVPRISREATAGPDAGLAGTLAWAARARAGAFVVRGGLDAERERVVRQANELASFALGEPVYAGRVSAVRERLERSG